MSRGLKRGLELAQSGAGVDEVRAAIINEIEKEPLSEIDYVEIVDLDTLEPASVMKNVLAAVAVYIGKTRLIDNFIIGE